MFLAAVFSFPGTLMPYIPRFCGALLSEADDGNDSLKPYRDNERERSPITITSTLRVARMHFVPTRSVLPTKRRVIWGEGY